VIRDQSAEVEADSLIAFLVGRGAAARTHAGGRRLLDHLVGTYEIVRRWEQPAALQRAALIHSVYGTDAYHQQLVSVSDRAELVEVAGEEAERLAYLFSVTAVDALAAGGPETPATRDECDALVLLHMANGAEQARADDGAPGAWLARMRELAELVEGRAPAALPPFVARLAGFTAEDESVARHAYLAALEDGDGAPEAQLARLSLAGAVCPVVPEPCIWQAYLSHCRDDLEMARAWARRGRRRLVELGTAWDKRLTFEQWLEVAGVLEQGGGGPPVSGIRDPRDLFEAYADSAGVPVGRVVRSPQEGRERLLRYVERIAVADRPASLGVYPDLDSQPWHDPTDFPVTRYLEAHFEEIREEILALEPSRFHRESERIDRSGDWDVAFFYERGRRRGEVCEACPVTTAGIENPETVRTLAGLIYVSRMRPGTHISPHRGPTNLRVRCHLGITVPDGDCAIRVGEETRSWVEGQCLVFDDYFEHEAWNHTREDRIVLIVDLWHPGLSPTEVRLLKGLHRYASTYGRQLSRYWSTNAAARAG
jgi:aspartate beta-hydroxylase